MVPYLSGEVRKRMDYISSQTVIEILNNSNARLSSYVDKSIDLGTRMQIERDVSAHKQRNMEEIQSITAIRHRYSDSRTASPKRHSHVAAVLVRKGMSLREIEDMISWRPVPIAGDERHHLKNLSKLLFIEKITRISDKARSDYAWIMTLHATSLNFPPNTHIQDPPARKYFELCLRRGFWQTYEIGVFLTHCFLLSGSILQEVPVKVPSNRYEETLRVERPQHDLVTDMELELSRLPRFRAYAKIAQEKDDRQTVQTHKIQTNPLPKIEDSQGEIKAIDNAHPSCKERDEIEEEIRARQSPWRDGGQSPPTTREQR